LTPPRLANPARFAGHCYDTTRRANVTGEANVSAGCVYGAAGDGAGFLSARIPRNPPLISHETPNATTQIVSRARKMCHDSGGSRHTTIKRIETPMIPPHVR